MLQLTNRILTTHTGSLPRTAKVVELLLAEEQKPGARKTELQAAVREAVAQVVAKQIECGIDIINDGEQGRTDYTVHVLKRLTGYEGESAPPMGTGEPEFPELAAQLKFFASPFQYRPACSGPVALEGLARGAGRHRSRQSGDAGRQGRRHFHDVALARTNRALPEEQLTTRTTRPTFPRSPT